MVENVPWRITFVTNPSLCNLHCDMCRVHSQYASSAKQNHAILDFACIEQTVRALAPLGLREIIPSTMGEPFLYPHFARMLALCVQTNVKLNITTNGTFPCGGLDYWVPQLLPVLRDIKISLLSLDPALNSHLMGGVDSKQQIKNLRDLLGLRDAYAQAGNKRCTVSLQVTRMRANAHELPALRAWALELGIDRVKINDLHVHFPEMQSEAVASACEQHEGACPFLGKEAWAMPDGRWAPCPHPLAWEGALGDLGCWPAVSLREAWEGAFRNVVRKGMKNALCKQCLFMNNK